MITLVIMIGILMFLMIFNTSETYRSWKIKLPGIQIDTVLFSDVFQDGDEISKYTYHNKRKMEKMIELNNFEAISPENISVIKDSLLDFYNRLGTNIKGTNGKEVYDTNIDVEKLLSTNNYYLIKRENQDKSYIILILDIEDKTLYTFTSVRH